MINGAQQIIGNVPGHYLNPFLVAESQSSDHTGYIVVIYNLEPMQYDLLFLQGRAITHCARMNKDLRFFIDQHVVTSTFRDHYKDSFVSLFTCDDTSIQRFIATFHSEPCLKVHVDALSKPQILALIRSTGCTQGIIERNDFSEMLPIIELKEIDSAKKLPLFKTRLEHGRLLVYDLIKNQEINSHRFAAQPFALHSPAGHKRKRRGPKQVSDTEASDDRRLKGVEPIPENPAEAIDALIHEILGDPQLSIDNRPLPIDNSNPVTTKSADFAQILPAKQTADQTEDANPTEAGPTPPKSRSSGTTINNQQDRHDPPEPSPPETPSEFQPSTQEILPTEETKQTKQTEPTIFTRTLERLLRSFRQQVVDLCAQRAESVFANAEKKVRMLTPEFDPRSFDDSNAVLVLDLIEEMVRQSPLLKRSKLREVAAELVSDLYNKQYELLEQNKAVDAVEQCYYRLKGSK